MPKPEEMVPTPPGRWEAFLTTQTAFHVVTYVILAWCLYLHTWTVAAGAAVGETLIFLRYDQRQRSRVEKARAEALSRLQAEQERALIAVENTARLAARGEEAVTPVSMMKLLWQGIGVGVEVPALRAAWRAGLAAEGLDAEEMDEQDPWEGMEP